MVTKKVSVSSHGYLFYRRINDADCVSQRLCGSGRIGRECTDMTLQEVKRTRLACQFLTRPCDKRSVVRGLCGVQAQFLSNARHALRIRCTEDLSDESWGEGLVKNWTLRGTMHVFGEEDLPLFLYGYPHALRPQDRLEGDAHITESRKRYFAGEILRLIGEGVCEREALKQSLFCARHDGRGK